MRLLECRLQNHLHALQIAGTPSAQPTSGGRTPYLPPDSSGMETLTLLSDIASAYCLGSSRCSATTGWIFELLQKNDKVIERITSNIRMNSVWSIILTSLLEDIRHHSFTYSMDTGIHTSSKNQHLKHSIPRIFQVTPDMSSLANLPTPL